MESKIDGKIVRKIIKKLAKKYNRSEEDIREMVMWQFQFLRDKIRETDVYNEKFFTIEFPHFGTFQLRKKLKYKILKYGLEKKDATENTSSGRSK